MNDPHDNFDEDAPQPATPFNTDTVEHPVVAADPATPPAEEPARAPRVNPMPSPPATREHFSMDTGEVMAILVPVPHSTFEPYDQDTGEGGEAASAAAH